MHINLPNNISQLFILAFIVIILIIIVSPNERGLIASIVVVLLAIGLDRNSKSEFKLDKIKQDEIKLDEPITAESLCKETSKYKGAIDCVDDTEPEKFKTEYKTNMYTSVDEDVDYDIKNATQGLKRNDYNRAITGLIDVKKRIYERNDIREELDEAEAERWEGNDDY